MNIQIPVKVSMGYNEPTELGVVVDFVVIRCDDGSSYVSAVVVFDDGTFGEVNLSRISRYKLCSPPSKSAAKKSKVKK